MNCVTRESYAVNERNRLRNISNVSLTGMLRRDTVKIGKLKRFREQEKDT